MNSFIGVDHRRCTGCKTCEVVCSLYHFDECNPQKSAIRVIRRENRGLVHSFPLVCRQCDPAPCLAACPAGALFRDEERGVLTVDRSACSGCGLCAAACPAGCISLDASGQTAIVCDLCSGRPQCVAFCHARCLAERSGGEEEDGWNADDLAKILMQEGFRDWMPAGRMR